MFEYFREGNWFQHLNEMSTSRILKTIKELVVHDIQGVQGHGYETVQ